MRPALSHRTLKLTGFGSHLVVDGRGGAVPVWIMHDSSAWDVQDLRQGDAKLCEAGHDPYSDAMAVQKLHHAAAA